ncbi:hypothetical protein, partial [Nocardia sp. NPDC051463]|uniref:hypothetical protein n=1 Tax=Nocardia sp. NPDC051463 TaxID=3154845 RepID=UPI00344B070C
MTDSGSDNTQRRSERLRRLPDHLEVIHAEYVMALVGAPITGETPRVYASQVRGFLAWLEETGIADAALAD